MALARIVGQRLTSQTEILAKLLHYADIRDLYDPTDGSWIILDSVMRDVFGRERMTIAELERQIGDHTV